MPLSESPESNEAPKQSVLQRIGMLAHGAWKATYESVTGNVHPEDAIHPAFLKRSVVDENLTWFQNLDWGMGVPPPYKIGFYFNDPKELDDCRWVGKFGRNLNPKFPEYAYFFVGYGDPNKFNDNYDLEAMVQWAAQFSHPSLMEYNGKLVRMFRQEDQS